MVRHDKPVADRPVSPDVQAARAMRKSKHTPRLLSALGTVESLADEAATILAKVSPDLADLDAKLSSIRFHSVNALLTETIPGALADIETQDARIRGAQNTIRDLGDRFLDLARTLRTIQHETEPMTARLVEYGYEVTAQ